MIRVVHSGSRIRILTFINPGLKKAPDPGSLIRNTGKEYTELQPPLSGVHSLLMEKLDQAGESRGYRPTPLHYSCHHVRSCSVCSSWTGRYTHPLSSLPIYVLCGLKGEWLNYPFSSSVLEQAEQPTFIIRRSISNQRKSFRQKIKSSVNENLYEFTEPKEFSTYKALYWHLQFNIVSWPDQKSKTKICCYF